MKQLFPKEFINGSLEHYTFQIGKGSNAIYLVIILSICVILTALPLVTINVTTTSNGLINTNAQRFQLRSPVNGVITHYRMYENQLAKKGDTLVKFDQTFLTSEFQQVSSHLDEINRFTMDLEKLLDNHSIDLPTLETSKYKIDFLQYQSTLEKLIFQKTALLKTYNRQKTLFEQEVISSADFENHETSYQNAVWEIEIFKKQSKNKWKQEMLGFEEETRQLLVRMNQIKNERSKYTLIAPASGELQNVSSLNNDQFIQSGTSLAELSPDTSLLSICWVTPKDIGLLKKGLQGKFRVDAYNSNDWGTLTGSIVDISSDAYIVDNRPFFKVSCDLEQDFLTLQNGYVGKLRKGMTVQGSFVVTQRTLFQLLYDKIDDWLNPNRK